MHRRPYILPFVFGMLALIGLAIAPYLVFVYAGIEKEMGLAQKIFYYHVSSAFAMYIGFSLCFVFSIRYLWKRDKRLRLMGGVFCRSRVALLQPGLAHRADLGQTRVGRVVGMGRPTHADPRALAHFCGVFHVADPH